MELPCRFPIDLLPILKIGIAFINFFLSWFIFTSFQLIHQKIHLFNCKSNMCWWLDASIYMHMRVSKCTTIQHSHSQVPESKAESNVTSVLHLYGWNVLLLNYTLLVFLASMSFSLEFFFWISCGPLWWICYSSFIMMNFLPIVQSP